MEKIKNFFKGCALIVSTAVVALLPVAILIATAVMNQYGTFGWALNIACSLVYLAFAGVLMKEGCELVKFFLFLSEVGALLLLLLVAVMSIFSSNESWYAPAPTMWAIAYTTTTITAGMFVMSDWRTAGGTKRYLFWCGFAMIACVALWCVTASILGFIGTEMPKLAETIFLFIEGTALFAGCIRLVVLTVSKAVKSGMVVSGRCFHSSCAMCLFALAMLIGYCALTSWGVKLPTAIEGVCGYLIGAGIVGIVLSFGIAFIKYYIDERKRKKINEKMNRG